MISKYLLNFVVVEINIILTILVIFKDKMRVMNNQALNRNK